MFSLILLNPTQQRSILIDRETIPFFRLFTREGDIEYTGCGNTEHRGQKTRLLPWLPSCPDLLETSVGEHVLRCDGSLNGLGLPYPRFEQKYSSASYTVNCSCLCSLHFMMLITNDRTSVAWRAAKYHCQIDKKFLQHIYLKIR